MKKAAALFLALVISLSLCACDRDQSPTTADKDQTQANYAMYLKDSELFFKDLKDESAAWQLTSRLVDDDKIKDEDLAVNGTFFACQTGVSKDGSLVFFADKVNTDDYGNNLYYRDARNPEVEAIKIDSDVINYAVNSSATVVTYAKGEECNLYQYSIKEDSKEKIASEVKEYYISEDGSKILYVNADGTLYAKSSGADKEKLASDISQVVYHTEDFTTVYYVKDELLYKQMIGGDKEKIDSNIYQIIQVYESGEVYYLKQEDSHTMMDYVVDDMIEADANAPESKPSKPYYYNYDTTEEYDEAYATYKEAYDAYYAKEARNEWRALLENTALDHSAYTLCFFNGTDKTTITESFAGDFQHAVSPESPVISYVTYHQKSITKMKISEISEFEDISILKEKIDEALFGSSDRFITVRETASVLELGNASNVFMNESGTTIFYVDDIPDGKDYGELYSVSIVDGIVGTPELYDSDVYTESCFFVSDSQFLYFKDYKNGNGDLYLNKTKIDYDVTDKFLDYSSKQDKLCYFTDWNSEKEYGTLKEYKNGEAAKIGDDIHGFTLTPDGRVLYLYDYSLKYYAGELYLWDNGENKKIDDDVIYLVPVSIRQDNASTAVANAVWNLYDDTRAYLKTILPYSSCTKGQEAIQ